MNEPTVLHHSSLLLSWPQSLVFRKRQFNQEKKVGCCSTEGPGKESLTSPASAHSCIHFKIFVERLRCMPGPGGGNTAVSPRPAWDTDRQTALKPALIWAARGAQGCREEDTEAI